jgi:hypothetical protein
MQIEVANQNPMSIRDCRLGEEAILTKESCGNLATEIRAMYRIERLFGRRRGR